MEEIDLYDLLRFFAKKWLTIATFVMIGGIIGVGYTYFVQTPSYDSKAQLLLVGNTRSTATDSVVLNNYVQLFTSHRVLDRVISDQKYTPGYNKLTGNTTTTNVKNTDIINVSIATSDPKQSKALLEDAIESFRKEAKALYGDNNIKINIVDSASVADKPSNVKPLVQIGLSIAAGFLLAIVSLFFVYDYRLSRGIKAVSAVATPATSTKKVRAATKKPATSAKKSVKKSKSTKKTKN